MSIFLRRGDLMLDISYYASLVRTESDKSELTLSHSYSYPLSPVLDFFETRTETGHKERQ